MKVLSTGPVSSIAMTSKSKPQKASSKRSLRLKIYGDPIVTEVTPFTVFYKAEDYHQDYYNQHGSQPYCQIAIRPKVEKFEKLFKDRMKK
jgi:peptide methionine sulfoxide reductase MsrA